MPLRVFFAISLPENVRQSLSELADAIPFVRWVPIANLHLTLEFIGEVDDETRDRLTRAAGSIQVRSFSMHLEGIGTFPKPGRPSVLWAGVRGGQPLQRLHEGLRDVVSGLGLTPEARAFTPHITVARIKHGVRTDVRSWLDRHDEYRSTPFDVHSFHLFSSEFGPSGVRYLRRSSYPLRNDESV